MSELSSDFLGAFFLGIVGGLLIWFGFQKGFFTKNPHPDWKPQTTLWHVCAGFGLYFAIVIFITPILAVILQRKGLPQIAFASWMNFLLSFSIFFALFLFWKSLPQKVRAPIWRAPDAHQTYSTDARFAVYTWCIAFPVAFAISQFLDTLMLYLFNLKELPDQLAVYFVKMSFQHPLYLFLAAISVVIFAPIVEEFLFRGLLQSFIRKHLGPQNAVLITSLCFSFFHFSGQQGIANIPIIGSLFVFALFLGFLYEKQGSLFASISLHALFNAISMINLYFFQDLPHGSL
ncbi:MAG: CPBP family intramembrane metalloprotease [Verrucomicrobiota bacterium]|nr:CPBP family intramembrane metalloprotease [Verrucomicrobiota bacterium]